MSIRLSHKNCYLAVVVLVLALALVACSPFGRRQQAATTPAVEPTPTSLPTQTPMPAIALATPTPTQVPQLATPTPTETATPLPTPTEEPTSVPTSQATAEPGETRTSGVLPAATSAASRSETGDALKNGSFEQGFADDGVALGWTALSTSGAGAVYAWLDEAGDENVSHGEHAQLMRIMGPGKPNQFVGIYQTFEVIPGETYTLTMHGLIRSSLADDQTDPLAFRYQWAVVDGGGTDWTAVAWTDWTELGWTSVKLDARNPTINAYVARLTPQSDRATLFIRGWSKWPLFQSEAKFYLDGVSVRGPVSPAGGGGAAPVSGTPAAGAPASGAQAEMPVTGGGKSWWIPVAGVILVLGLAVWEVRKRRAQ